MSGKSTKKHCKCAENVCCQPNHPDAGDVKSPKMAVYQLLKVCYFHIKYKNFILDN
jgi:hypothetical protein